MSISRVRMVINMTTPTKGVKTDNGLSSIKIGSGFLYFLFFVIHCHCPSLHIY